MMTDDQIKQLQQEWYQKLEEHGFEDIENTKHPQKPLHSWHSFKWKNIPLQKIRLIQDYYLRAERLIETYPFESQLHKTIWILHCDGLSKRKIEVAISGQLKREAIGNIIVFIASSIK